MAKLSSLINMYYAFEVDKVSFLVATGEHPNPGWKSYFEEAPGLPSDPIGGDGPARTFNFNSESSGSQPIIQIVVPFVKTYRFDSNNKSFCYVQDGHGYHKVDINVVT